MASSCRDKLRTSGWRYGESQINQWFNLLRHVLKCLEEVVLDTGLDVPSFCRARCGQQRGGEGAELQSDVAEGLCIRTKGRRETKTETGDSDFFLLGCQRKSV